MIRRPFIATILLLLGLMCFYTAHKALQLHLISDNGYSRLYSLGLMLWSIRSRIERVSLPDAMCANVVMWLCIFNVMDEYISKTPATPYKPYIASIIIIITTIYIYYRKCRKDTKM